MGFHKLPKVESMVAQILLEEPKTRDSDELLTICLYRDYYGIGKESFVDVMLMRRQLGLPSIETIGRCRRKLQERAPMIYGSSINTKSKRAAAEDEFKDYARGL